MWKELRFAEEWGPHCRVSITQWCESESVSRLVVSDSVTTGTVAYQAPLSMELSRQEYRSVLPLPVPGDLPDP